MTTPTLPIGAAQLDVDDLRGKVQHMYEAVADHPRDGHFHFEIGRALAERSAIQRPIRLNRPPSSRSRGRLLLRSRGARAQRASGRSRQRLGHGSFIAALHVGASGRVIGIDMTGAQRDKAAGARAGFAQVEFRPGFIEEIPPGRAKPIASSPTRHQFCADKAVLLRPRACCDRAGDRDRGIVTDLPLPET
jgi:hypothetical protein